MTTPLLKSWAVTDVDGEITTLDARHAIGSGYLPGATGVVKRSGVLPGPGSPGNVTATSPTPNNIVSVAPFHLIMSPTRTTPPYVITCDATKTFNAFATPPSASANRRDLIVIQQNDGTLGDLTSECNLRYIVGNSPSSDPAVTGSPDYVILAQVVVRQNATSVLQSDITMRLPAGFRTVALGGILPIDSLAERNAITPYASQVIDRRDRGWMERYDGTAWRVIGVPKVATSGSLTDITNPENGDLAMSIGSGYLYQRVAGAWVVAAVGRGAPRGMLAYVQGAADVAVNAGEVKLDQLVFTHTVNRYEEMNFRSRFNINAIDGRVIIRIRYIAGSGTVTTAGTLAYETILRGDNGNNYVNLTKLLHATFQALASGTYTLGVFVVCAAGATAGTFNGSATGQERDFTVMDVGGL